MRGFKAPLLFAALSLPQAWAIRTPLSHPCSRPISRDMRKKIDEVILKKPLEDHNIEEYEVPDDCPFKKENNIWAFHESQKRRKRLAGQLTWECGICGKKFKSEHYLDLHMETHHMNQATAKTCLVDYCHMFNLCDEKTSYARSRAAAKMTEDDWCDEEVQKAAQQRCEDSIRTCFPLESKTRLVNIELRRNICAMMSCEIKKQFKSEESSSLLSTIAVAVAIFLFFMVFFGIVICCVDYSEDIVQNIVEWKLAGTGLLRGFVRTRDNARKAAGVDKKKTRQI